MFIYKSLCRTNEFVANISDRIAGAPGVLSRGVISTFSWGPKFFLFFNATGLLKNWKKQHFICSNLTLFIVPFFLFFSVFLFSFSVFLFSLFFLFFFFLEGGDGPPAPLNDASGSIPASSSIYKFLATELVWFIGYRNNR